MKHPVFLILFLLFSPFLKAQSVYSGNVVDAWDKKYLEGVTSLIKGKKSVQTNSRGYFSLQADIGDTLLLTFPGFIEQEFILGEEKFLLIELQDRARLLPTFQVKAEPYKFRFKDGKLYLAEDEAEGVKSLSTKASMGTLDPTSGMGGVAFVGVLSQLTKRNRELRAYEEKLDWLKRRAGYLEVIDSETIREDLMGKYKLNRQAYDALVVRFNEFHQTHDFLDWSSERVLASLKEFIRIESYLVN